MKKEKLFRGKRKDNGEWVYGNLIRNHDDCYIKDCENNEKVMVESSSIGRYIGYKDKNGKKVFEGDIIYEESVGCTAYGYNYFKIEKWFLIEEFHPHISNTKVYKFKEKRGEYIWYLDREQSKSQYASFSDIRNVTILIGNIHDNPELIHSKEA